MKRYSPYAYKINEYDAEADMKEDEQGDWVELEDHLKAIKRLKDKIKKLEFELKEYKKEVFILD